MNAHLTPHGLLPIAPGDRMTADEFLALPELPLRWELIEGVVEMSPSPSYRHQDIMFEIRLQLHRYLQRNRLGKASHDVEVRLDATLVYRPDVIYLSNAKAARVGVHVHEPPDLICEVLSPESAKHDRVRKFADYQRFGVGEYWLIDPDQRSMQFFVLREGAYCEARAEGDRYAATILPGFVLDLAEIRKLFA